MNSKLALYILIFSILNLSFIPLIAAYGTRVCPVLSVAGFWFGCFYSGLYILISNILNLGFLIARTRIKLNLSDSVSSLLGYLFASAIALIFLNYQLDTQHLSTQSRAPEILFFTSLLLAMTQIYGLNWVGLQNQSSEPKKTSLRQDWFEHVARTLVPIVTCLGLIIHFHISQSQSFNAGRTATVVNHDTMIQHTTLLILFLLIWLITTFTFHFLSENKAITQLKKHFSELQLLNTHYRSPSENSWGLWRLILQQLNEFSVVLSERTHLLKSFSRFVTAGVAKQALKTELQQTAGMTLETTILMTDIRNFTTLSESLNPHQTVDLLNSYFTAMLDVLVKHQITLDKFIGDGILAYVETKEMRENNEIEENSLAVVASLEMLHRLKQVNQDLLKQKLPQVEIGIGLFRGPVIVGLIGSSTRLQHTIIGDSVNKASRLEGLTKELQTPILISDQIWQTLPSDLKNKFQSRGKHFLKGISEPIEIFGLI